TDSDAIAKSVLVHLPGRSEGQDRLVARLGGEGEHRLRLVGIVDQARLARGGDVALELDRERRRARDVERLEGQRGGAAQMKAAPGEERGGGADDDRAHHTTTFTRRPGTTTTFFTGLPSANLTTAS